MRTAGKLKLGYFPLPSDEAGRIRGFLRPPATQYAALDPCIGRESGISSLIKKGEAMKEKQRQQRLKGRQD